MVVAFTVNLHLPVFQVVAWTRMLVAYSHDYTFTEAVDMTFDGEHPCPMCTAIQAAATNHEADDALQAAAPAHPLYVAESVPDWIHTLVLLGRFDHPSAAMPGRPVHPLAPPPRSANA